MNTDGTGSYTCKEYHKTESLWNHTTIDHKEGEQLEDRRNVGASSSNCGDRTDQRVQSLMFMMMMMMMMMQKMILCTLQPAKFRPKSVLKNFLKWYCVFFQSRLNFYLFFVFCVEVVRLLLFAPILLWVCVCVCVCVCIYISKLSPTFSRPFVLIRLLIPFLFPSARDSRHPIATHPRHAVIQLGRVSEV